MLGLRPLSFCQRAAKLFQEGRSWNFLLGTESQRCPIILP